MEAQRVGRYFVYSFEHACCSRWFKEHATLPYAACLTAPSQAEHRHSHAHPQSPVRLFREDGEGQVVEQKPLHASESGNTTNSIKSIPIAAMLSRVSYPFWWMIPLLFVECMRYWHQLVRITYSPRLHHYQQAVVIKSPGLCSYLVWVESG